MLAQRKPAGLRAIGTTYVKIARLWETSLCHRSHAPSYEPKRQIAVNIPGTVVVLPTYNEAANLAEMVEALWGLPVRELHVLVVDDASPDGTGRIADELASRRPGCLDV